MRYYIEEDTSTTPPTLVKVPICGSYINYNTAPIGSIQTYAGTALPPGWLFCNGSAYNRTYFPFLFKVIGTTYGSGDGSTTFNVPNIPDLATGIKYIIKAYSTADAKTLGIDLPDNPTGSGGHWAHVYEQWTSYLNGLTPGSTFVAPKTGILYLHPSSPPAGAAADIVYRSYIAPVENGVTMPSIIWVSQSMTQISSMITNTCSGILKKGHTYTLNTNNPNAFCFAATFLEYIEDEEDPDPAGDTYSTIETRVGTWIDGKPIYRKVLQVNNPKWDWTPNTFTIPGISQIIKANVIAWPDTATNPNFYWTENWAHISSNSYFISTINNGRFLLYENTSLPANPNSSKVIWIIEYTKQ